MSKGGKAVNIQEIATAAAKEALRLQRKEERDRIRKNRYHNTELLLQNYLRLVDHRDNSKDKASDIFGPEELEEMGVDDIVVRSIMRSRARTKVMINQIETCMDMLKTRMESQGQGKKYEVLYCLYMDPARRDLEWGQRIQAVAEELYCSSDSVRRWKNEMVKILSVWLFGVDGLKLEL
jgi:hypothetical protein